MGVGHTPLPSGAALHFGNLIHRKNVAAKSRRGVIVCAPRSTRDVQVVYDLLLAQRRSRAATKNESNTNTATGAGEPKKEDYETLGHLTQAALSGCPLMIVGTTAPTFIHFSTVDAILDERESGSACNFVIVTMDKEHRFAADMSTDYTEWIYALRDAMTIGNRHSFRGNSRDDDDDTDSNADDDDAPLDHPTPAAASSSVFKRAKSLGRSPSAVNLNFTMKRFGFPTRSHTYDAHSAAASVPPATSTPRAVYDLPSDDDNDNHIEEHDSRSGGSPPRESVFVDSSLDNSSGEIVPVLPVPYVPRPATTASTTSTTPSSTVRRRSDANVRFAERPAAPPKDAPVAETTTTAVAEEEEEDEQNAALDSNHDEEDADEDDPTVAPRARIGGMVGQVPPQHRAAMAASTSDLPITTHPSVNKSLSRKLSTFFGVDPTTAAAGGPKSPSIDGNSSTTSSAAKGAKSIGRKFTNIIAAAAAAATSSNTSDADRRGRGRTDKSTAAAPATGSSSSAREPRARSLVRMFSRSSVTDGTTPEENVEGDITTTERDSRRARSSTRGARSRSRSRTRLFTLVPSVRYTGSASLGNMFRKHTGDPEIDDDDIVAVVPSSRSRSPAPAAAAAAPAAEEEDEEDEELPRRRRSARSGPLRTVN
ncbi:hypothetical protein HDU89_001002 [Geranomyces variabilis]|nr:hypothetical protein HDU89_001002 [Geranomyces variabilis]